MKKVFNRYCFLFRMSFIIRVVLGCMYIMSALPKIRQPYEFLSNLYGYEFLSPKMGLFVAMTVPWIELLVGIVLLSSIFVSGALLVSAGMGVVFTFMLSWAIHHELDISCGCFGSSVNRIDYWTLIRAILIMFFSVIAYLSSVFSFSLIKKQSYSKK